MKVLVLGSGGREHALAWKISQSRLVKAVYCAPGNAGTSEIAENLKISVDEHDEIISFAVRNGVDLAVVGPEAPLVAGIGDRLREQGINVFGPSGKGAMLEGSKKFAKDIMEKYGIPTAKTASFTDHESASEYARALDMPLVVKADGLAAGKGVVVAMDTETALSALDECFIQKKFGAAGSLVLIEEYLEGQEVTLMAFTDGDALIPMVPAQDYKRAFDDDMGPNTGGMGSYSPVPIVDDAIYEQIVETALKPTVAALKNEGIDYRGVLYAGMILTQNGPKVLEFNARFGDPETQAVIPRLNGDLFEIMLRTAKKELGDMTIGWADQKCVSVVLASGGYPGTYGIDNPISGLDDAHSMSGAIIFHAGTALRNGRIVTAGGRVLNVSALGSSFAEARDKAYAAIEKISFEGMQYRQDIALRACKAAL